MKYKFYVEFLRNKSPWAIVARLIRFSIKRDYNHVEIVAVPLDGSSPIYYGSIAPVSRKATRAEVREHYEVIKRYELKMHLDYTGEQVIEYLESLLNIRYSYIQNAILLPMACWGFLKKLWAHLSVNGLEEITCVELVARPLVERFGYKLRTSFDMVEFEDIVKALEAGQAPEVKGE